MPGHGRKIFLSYSHKDEDLMQQIKSAFLSYGDTTEEQFDFWVDEEIRAGDDWLEKIERAMNEAHVALLLLSTEFKNSEFIKTREVATLLARKESEGLRVIPIIGKPCPWKSWDSINKAQVKPKGGQPLSAMPKAKREQALTDLVTEVAEILNEEQTRAPALAQSVEARLTDLFERTLCSKLDAADQGKAVRYLVKLLQDHCHSEPQQIFKAARYLVEYRLLVSEDEPHCHLGAYGNPGFPGGDKELRAVLEKLKDRWRKADFQPEIQLKPGPFLQRALEYAEDWYRYFNALRVGQGANQDAHGIESLCLLDIGGGALAPQYLLAGLMSHFHDDWKPVIDSYSLVGNQAGELERLTASQWICWLVWGPSIPLCTCEHWVPASAYQFGYGDENNSLPAYLSTAPDSMRNLMRDSKAGERRAIELEKLSGRLVWAPITFSGPGRFAGAQARLTLEEDENDRANVHRTDGLLIKVEDAQPREALPNEPSYFTSYIWMMFWISARRQNDNELPSRLNGMPLPQPAADVGKNSRALASARLWKDLLPVFVHANIFDPVVLRVQKGMLIENALHLLKRISAATDAPMEFHLVCSSDYAGCGCAIAFPPPKEESLVQLLAKRIAELPGADKAFADSIRLPRDNEAASERPAALRAFFSACHLPEMVEGYYQFLRKRIES